MQIKSLIVSAIIGGAVGAIVLMVVLIILNKFTPIATIDLLSFALIILGVIVTAFTILGSFTLVNTWNDIDARSRAIVEKYQRDAKQEIDTYQKNVTQEIERNSTERQHVINETADKATTMINQARQATENYVTKGQWLLGALGAASLLFLGYALSRIHQMENAYKRNHQQP
jgi:ElaB/YqjD/DUF883 family membrane-anchored ribosome-binding protein